MTDKERDNILLAESRDEKDKIARDHRERNKDYTIYLKAGEYSAPDFISFITEVSSASGAAHDENCAGEQQEATTIVKRAERSENLTKTLDRRVDHMTQLMPGLLQGSSISPLQLLQRQNANYCTTTDSDSPARMDKELEAAASCLKKLRGKKERIKAIYTEHYAKQLAAREEREKQEEALKHKIRVIEDEQEVSANMMVMSGRSRLQRQNQEIEKRTIENIAGKIVTYNAVPPTPELAATEGKEVKLKFNTVKPRADPTLSTG